MKKYIYIGVAAIVLALLAIVSLQNRKINKIKSERDLYESNTNVLLGDITHYQTKDSLNAVSVGNLELKISEYKKYREDDYKLIESLKVDKKRLEEITTVQAQTIYELKGTVRDSIIYVDNYIIDTLKCLKINDEWFSFNGCIGKNNEFSGTFENRDSFVYVEHIIPKKFLFIKYGVKERKQDIVSKNPYTTIINSEYISIRK